MKTADVRVNGAGVCQQAGSIRTSAAGNLTGAPGAPGATGTHGSPGAPGTNVVLGVKAPDPETCPIDGDVFIDSSTSLYDSCVGGICTLFGPQWPGVTAAG